MAGDCGGGLPGSGDRMDIRMGDAFNGAAESAVAGVCDRADRNRDGLPDPDFDAVSAREKAILAAAGGLGAGVSVCEPTDIDGVPGSGGRFFGVVPYRFQRSGGVGRDCGGRTAALPAGGVYAVTGGADVVAIGCGAGG